MYYTEIARVLLRYITISSISLGLFADERLAEKFLLNPDIVVLTALAIGALVESSWLRSLFKRVKSNG